MNPGRARNYSARGAPAMNQVAHAAGMRAAAFLRDPLLQPRARRQGPLLRGDKSGDRSTCANPITGDHLPQRTSSGRAPSPVILFLSWSRTSGAGRQNAARAPERRVPGDPASPKPLTALECTPRHARDGEVDYAHVLGARGRFAVVLGARKTARRSVIDSQEKNGARVPQLSVGLQLPEAISRSYLTAGRLYGSVFIIYCCDRPYPRERR